MNDIPKPDELDDIWFYMNYRLNFIKFLNRKIKIDNAKFNFFRLRSQQTAPDNAIVIFFCLFAI